MIEKPDYERISSVIEWWLGQEVVNSDSGRNAYLSEYQSRRSDFMKPFDNPENVAANKTRSHYDRFTPWVEPYGEPVFRDNDWFTARIIFASLMHVAGAYRNQCIIEAADSEDYKKKRYDLPVGVDIPSIIKAEIDSLVQESSASQDTDKILKRVIDRSLQTNEAVLLLHEQMHDWTASHDVVGWLSDPTYNPAEVMKDVQKMWLGLTVAHIAVAANLRGGDYSKVPFLEPKSISDVSEVIYPIGEK